MPETKKILIDGKWVDSQSGEIFPVKNPATGETLWQVAKGGKEDVNIAVDAAYRAFEEGSWGRSTAAERAQILFCIAKLLREKKEEIALLEVKSAGKTISDARGEVGAAASCFEYYAGAATKLFGETIPVSGNGLDFTLREPLGVAALIVPWNFPLLIASWKLAPALAAGCTAVLKPASYTPISALALGDILLEACVPAGVVNILCGPGKEVGGALATHAKVAKIAFTGETSTGQELLRLGAGTMKRISLELGGKSPLIIFDDAEIDRAIEQTPYSVFGNAGQDCCARSRGFIHRSVYEKFVKGFCEKTASLQIGDPLNPNTEIGPIISAQQLTHIKRYIDIGTQEGANLRLGGEKISQSDLENGNFLRPAVFDQVKNSMQIAQEEIFGPVASFIPFSEEDELIHMVNDSPYGLSGSIWTRDIGRALRVAKRVKSGVLGINSNQSVFIEAPFGGYKMSGLGRDLGMNALENYTEVKNIFVSLE